MQENSNPATFLIQQPPLKELFISKSLVDPYSGLFSSTLKINKSQIVHFPVAGGGSALGRICRGERGDFLIINFHSLSNRIESGIFFSRLNTEARTFLQDTRRDHLLFTRLIIIINLFIKFIGNFCMQIY